jgi:hypothetical protein
MTEVSSTNVQTVINTLKDNPHLVRKLAQELAMLTKEANVQLTDSEKTALLSGIARAATKKVLALEWPNEKLK